MADKLDDSDFLSVVERERQASVGFEHDQELTAARELALNYYKGFMPDMAVPEENRSRATSSDIADAIETVLPDVVEIFIGDDVATFEALGEDDEAQAQLETDYINHVVMNLNNGFMLFYTAFKDAFLSKTGIWHWWWEDGEEQEREYTAKPAAVVGMLPPDSVSDITRQDGEDYDPQTTQPHDLLNFTVTNQKHGYPCIANIAPEDFTVSADTVALKDAPYCAYRSRPRAQELIEQGYDEDKVAKLPPYGLPANTEQYARDTAGESQQAHTSDGHNLHQVEIVTHFLRIDANGDGKTELWRVVTGNDEGVLLEREEIKRLPVAAVTPYVTTHRFYGESIADKLIQTQRIKTALNRIGLDSAYFAVSPRHELNMDRCTEDTVSDYLDATPGRPIRSHGEAIVPVPAGQLGFDPYAALEYHSTVAEQRTGVVRNAQGLNPDTLHDTAGGALALMAAAQRRTRFLARVFAETGVKDLFLGLHAMMRDYAERDEDGPKQPRRAKLKGKWVNDIRPADWLERDDMNIEIGIGSGGAMHEMAVLEKVIGFQTQAVMEQGGISGPFVNGENLYRATMRWTQRAGLKNGDAYFTDPSTQPPPQPRPDPRAAVEQGKLQLEGQKAQGQAQLEMQKAQHAAAVSTASLQTDAAHKQAQVQIDAEIAAAKLQMEREKHEQELSLKAETVHAELAMKQWQNEQNVAMARDKADRDHEFRMKSVAGRPVEVGGEPG